MVSLAAVWDSWGVTPSAVLGHSQGEIAAACAGGWLSLQDAARIVVLRSRALSALAGRGGMVSLGVGEQQARELVARVDGVGVAAVNGPASVVVSGDTRALEELLGVCAELDVRARRIEVDYASHSAAVAELEDELMALLADVVPQVGKVPMFSTVENRWVEGPELNAAYWYRNLREEVGFDAAVRTLVGEGFRTFVEVSPHPVLTASVQHTLEDAGGNGVVVGSLRRDEDGLEWLYRGLGELWCAGMGVDWPAVYAGTGARWMRLPTYAFQHQRYWLTPSDIEGARSLVTPGPTTSGQITPDQTAPDQTAPNQAEVWDLDRPPAELTKSLLDLVRREAAGILGYDGPDSVTANGSFSSAGFESLTAVQFRNRMSERTGLTLPITLVFDYPTPAKLVEYLMGQLAPEGNPGSAALSELDRLETILTTVSTDDPDHPHITGRLKAILARWSDTTDPKTHAPVGVVDRIGSATEDEVLRFIDTELGRAAS
jgi:acyl transferase domain-containing protein